jgi:hypothetical protein
MAKITLEPARDICKCEEKACFSELQGAKPKPRLVAMAGFQRRKRSCQAALPQGPAGQTLQRPSGTNSRPQTYN